jgi:hypothetical protein
LRLLRDGHKKPPRDAAVDSSKVNYIFTKELATFDGIQRRSHSTLRDLDSD